jgi:hypothetical protein
MMHHLNAGREHSEQSAYDIRHTQICKNREFVRTVKSRIFIMVLLSGLIVPPSCNYLDVVPDNIATVDHAFVDRNHAESYLYGCFSFLPHFSPNHWPSLLAGDEAWLFDEVNTDVLNTRFWRIAKGEQSVSQPLGDYWASKQDGDLRGGTAMFTAIRDVNIFLENIYIPGDLSVDERDWWIAEAKFLKAFYHFWLFRCYGPIPVVDKNLPVSAGPEEVQVYRQPVDSVVNYIVNLLDEAAEGLPHAVPNFISDLGRPTKAVAAAVKAQTLVLAASPLFNGNSYYAEHNLVDNRGVSLFSTGITPDPAKWQRAAVAVRQAIEYADTADHRLFDFNESDIVSGGRVHRPTVDAMQSRGAATENWNPEIIWGQLPRDNPDLIQRMSFPPFTETNKSITLLMCYAPPLHIVEQFHSKNGIPIDEDADWADIDRYGVSAGDEAHKYYIQPGFETLNLHFNREPRFYGAITFDGSLYYANGSFTDTDLKPTLFKYGTLGGFIYDRHSATGYLQRKMINIFTSMTETATGPTYNRYSYPVIRLADLYLLYAEALNETVPDGGRPPGEVYDYVDAVRKRSGLKGVEESWRDHAAPAFRDKPQTKEGMRDIIRRERLIELAFEGSRFWDLRRWKWSEIYLNRPVRGLNILGATTEEFNRVQELYRPKFEQKDYLWPLRQGNLLKNKNLVQNPGWE